MSGECQRCFEHCLDCKCAMVSKLTVNIYELISKSDSKIKKISGDALVRVLVHLCYENDWSLEETQSEISNAIKYYYSHEELYNKKVIP